MKITNRAVLLKLGAIGIAVTLISLAGSGADMPAGSPNSPLRNQNVETIRELPLSECLVIAMRENHRRPASRYAVVMAEAQHRQALAGYWPQIGVKGGYQRLDESPNFLFPASQMHVPAGPATIMVPAQLVNPAAPAGMLVPTSPGRQVDGP